MTAPRTPRNTAAPKKVTLDLDALEREGGPIEPFTVKVTADGKTKVVTLTDPQELDWQTLARIGEGNSIHLFFRQVIPADEYEHFILARIAGWKMERLQREYMEHYGFDSGVLGN